MDENNKVKNMNPPLNENTESNTYHKDKEKEKHNHNDKDSINGNCGCPPPPQPPNTQPYSCYDVAHKDVHYETCDLIKTTEFNDVTLNCIGRLLEVNVKLKNVCPDKQVSVGVLVYENTKLLSLKVCKVSTHGKNCISELDAGKFCFVFNDSSLTCPPARTFTVKIIAHYLK